MAGGWERPPTLSDAIVFAPSALVMPGAGQTLS